MVFLFSVIGFGQSPLPFSHAHNDYLKKAPLHQALGYGFLSIEVDLFVKKNKLIVAHTRLGKLRNVSFEQLYIVPLIHYVNKRNGCVYEKDSTTLTLMIDIKEMPDAVVTKLAELMGQHPTVFKLSEEWAPIHILLSGQRPSKEVLDSFPFFQLDGRMHELYQEEIIPQITRVSASYKHYFKWRGKGEMPPEELDRLIALVSKAKELGVPLRFWGMPNHPKVWGVFIDQGVSWMNIDDYQRYAEFIRLL